MLAVEYLAPEFVFNLGHDFAADLWALGITLYEMFLGVTPFAPKRADNITELFNNIAITKVFVIRHRIFVPSLFIILIMKRKGVNLSSRLDEKAQTPLARALVLRLLAPEPSEYFVLL